MEVNCEINHDALGIDNNSLSPPNPVFPPLLPSPSSVSNSVEASEDEDETDDYEEGVMPPYHQALITKFVVQLIQERRAKRQRRSVSERFNPNWSEELPSAIQLIPKFQFNIGNQDLAKEADAYKKHVNNVIKNVKPPPEAYNQVAFALLDEQVKQLITSLGQDLMDNRGLPTFEAIMATTDALVLAQSQTTTSKKQPKSKST